MRKWYPCNEKLHKAMVKRNTSSELTQKICSASQSLYAIFHCMDTISLFICKNYYVQIFSTITCTHSVRRTVGKTIGYHAKCDVCLADVYSLAFPLCCLADEHCKQSFLCVILGLMSPPATQIREKFRETTVVMLTLSLGPDND